jgi:hypothetical protein
MMNSNRYFPFALVAVVAGILGWGASTLMSKETTNAMQAGQALTAPALGFQGQMQPQYVTGAQAAQLAAQTPMTLVAVPVQPAMPVVVAGEAPAPVVRTASAKARPAVYQSADEPINSVPVRKKGMSNKLKTAIVIGGGAATGAAIGAIAGGKKGAAIGAIAGGGGGALYSIFKHKKRQPVF